MNRREWLLAAAGSITAFERDLKANARESLTLGVFTNVYSKFPVAEAAKRIAADGFRGVVLEFAFADVRFDPAHPDWSAAAKVVDALGAAGVKIAALAGYYNVVDPDPERRARGAANARCLIENWERLGSRIVCTETGTLNRQSQWLESPENDTEAAYTECRTSLGSLAALARKTGAQLAIEPYWRNIIGSAERAQRLFRDERNTGSLKLVMDPANYFKGPDLVRMQPMLEDIFARVGRETVIAHAKDVKASADGTDLPAAGLGVLDYPTYLRLLASLNRPLCLVIEHLGLEDVPRARDYVLSQFAKV